MCRSEIPSVEQIRAATDVLSASDASAKVVRLGQEFAVKFGRTVSVLEGETQRFVEENTAVPVPKVFEIFSDPATGINYIVMEFIYGMTLERIWESLQPAETLDISRQIATAVDELRRLPPPPYIGGVGRQSLLNGVFWVPENDPLISGPFQTEEEMNEGIIRRLEQTQALSHLSLLRLLITTTLQNHRIVFTHGDLQRKNIMVNRTGTREDGNGIFEIKLIDWEISGWYPEYWEFCNATVAGRFRPEWLEVVQRILQIYPTEYLMMLAIRNILFY
ncbi:MAG: hypothetical protein M1818_008410 [Claussenomyces sp. TS43310]|nr:MAG: hypothetical protein M1818_008410 [Claussenomyces sp. TS43310]